VPRWPPEHSLELLKGREEEETEDERDKRETRERQERDDGDGGARRKENKINTFYTHILLAFLEREMRRRDRERWRIGERPYLIVFGIGSAFMEREKRRREKRKEKRDEEKRDEERDSGRRGGGITSFGETTFFLGWGGQRQGFRFWLLAFGFWLLAFGFGDFGTLGL